MPHIVTRYLFIDLGDPVNCEILIVTAATKESAIEKASKYTGQEISYIEQGYRTIPYRNIKELGIGEKH